MKRLTIIVIALISLAGVRCEAQRFSVSTNLLGYAALGTINAEGSYSFSRRFSVTAGARYNPFAYRKDDPESQFQLRQQAYSLGVRIWPWHTWSGWWVEGKGRYQEYNFGGIRSRETEEGDRIGLGMCAGYTYMLSPHFNLEFGLGLWAGLDYYKLYSCQVCGVTMDSGRRTFVLPDDVMISLVYVF